MNKNKRNHSLRDYFYDLLFVPYGLKSQIINGIVAFLIILSSATIPFYIIPYFSFIETELWYLEVCIVLLFSIEYILRVWSAKKRVSYLFSFDGIIDFVAIFPFFLEELHIIPHEFAILVLVRMMRFLRIIKLVKMYERERREMVRHLEEGHGNFITMKGERIEKVVHKHWFIFFFSLILFVLFTFFGLLVFVIGPAYIITLIIGISFFVLAFVSFMKSWIDFHYDAIYITNYRLVIQNRHLFGMQRTEIPYRAITTVHPDTTGILKTMLNFGSISVERAGESRNSIFPYVHNVVDIVSMITMRMGDRQRQRDDQIAQLLATQKNSPNTEELPPIPQKKNQEKLPEKNKERDHHNDYFQKQSSNYRQSHFGGVRHNTCTCIYHLLSHKRHK